MVSTPTRNSAVSPACPLCVGTGACLGKKPCLFSLHNHFLSLNLCLPFLGCVQQTFQQIVQFHIAVKCGAIAFVCKVLNQFHDFSQLLNLLIISVTNPVDLILQTIQALLENLSLSTF